MSSLRDLYQEVILDHSKSPRNFSEIVDADRKADGHNPLCGDKVTIYLNLHNGVVKDVSFTGVGCAISTASASLMTEAVKGKTAAETEQLFKGFHELVTGKASGKSNFGELVVFRGISEFPVRVKCATLAWHTLRAALDEEGQAVSTE